LTYAPESDRDVDVLPPRPCGAAGVVTGDVRRSTRRDARRRRAACWVLIAYRLATSACPALTFAAGRA